MSRCRLEKSGFITLANYEKYSPRMLGTEVIRRFKNLTRTSEVTGITEVASAKHVSVCFFNSKTPLCVCPLPTEWNSFH